MPIRKISSRYFLLPVPLITRDEYSNPEFDALLAQAAAETDEAASLALYRQAEQILVDDWACIPLWTGENMYLFQSYVKGYSVNALGQVS